MRGHQLSLWERVGPEKDGLAYYDSDFALISNAPDLKKSIDVRRDADSSTTTEGTPSDEKTAQQAGGVAESSIDFSNFACNIIARHWICSKRSAPFCVFSRLPFLRPPEFL